MPTLAEVGAEINPKSELEQDDYHCNDCYYKDDLLEGSGER